MASVRYILDRSADYNPSRWNPAELRDPLLPDLLIGTGHIIVSVESEQVLHLYKNAPRSWRTYRLLYVPKMIDGQNR